MPDATHRRRGRPRKDVPSEKAAEAVRLWHRGYGSPTIERRTGLSGRQVDTVLRSKRLSRGRTITQRWTSRQEAYLVEHVGEKSPATLAKDVSKLGPVRTEGAVRTHLSEMSRRPDADRRLSGFDPGEDGARHHVLPTLRLDLTLEQAAALVGRDTETLLRRIRASDVQLRKVDGAYRIWPSELRGLIAEDKRLVDWSRVEDRERLVSLLLGELGTGRETERKAAQRARKAERADG